MATALRVSHDSLPSGSVTFSDDECVEIEVFRQQEVNVQRAQAGNKSMVYIGEEMYDFEIQFQIFRKSSLENLERIRHLRSTFTIFPFLIEEPFTSFVVFWPSEPTLRERWVRGRRMAQWDHPVVWMESRSVTCPPVGSS